jgi:hypothetical protein
VTNLREPRRICPGPKEACRCRLRLVPDVGAAPTGVPFNCAVLHHACAGTAPGGTPPISPNALIKLVFVHCNITWHD